MVGAQIPLLIISISVSILQAYVVRSIPGRPVGLGQLWQLLRPVEDMSYQLPSLQVLAGMYRYARERIEARRGAEEGVFPLGNKDTAWVWVEAGQYRVAECAVDPMT